MENKSAPPNRQQGPLRAPEFLRELADHAAHVIAAQGHIDDATAIALGQEIAMRMAEVFGGLRVWIPRGTWNGRGPGCFEIQKRDLAIYRAYNGRNWRDVCASYHISRPRLFEIVRAVRLRLRVAATVTASPPMFGLSAPAAPAPTSRREI